MASRSFMDAIKSVGRKSADLTEGAKDKTSDGMTKDAKHFAQDLHKVQDSGMKHLVQKDSETKDYEKMFKGDVEKFPTRPADMEPSQSLDKYVEYNEAIQLEAKKLSKKDDQKTGDNPDNEDATGPLTNEAKKHDKDCKCEDCKKTVAEIYVNPNDNTPAGKALTKSLSGPNASTLPNQAGQGPASPMRKQGTSGAAKPPVRAPQAPSAPANKFRKDISTNSNATTKKPSATGAMVQSVARDIRSQPSQGLKTVTSTSQIKPSGMSGNYSNTSRPTITAGSASKAAGAMAIQRNKSAQAAKSQSSSMGGGSVNKTVASPMSGQGSAGANPKKVTPTGNPNMAGSGSGGVKVVPTSGPPPAKSAKPGATKPGASAAPSKKPGAAQQIKPIRPAGTPKTGGTKNNDVGPRAKPQGGVTTGKVTGTTATNKPRVAGVNNLRQSYEIEWNGNSYVMNEAAIEALGTFIEKYGQVNEVVNMTDTKEVVHDFAHSKNKKFAGKSTKERIRMALGASYAAKRGK